MPTLRQAQYSINVTWESAQAESAACGHVASETWDVGDCQLFFEPRSAERKALYRYKQLILKQSCKQEVLMEVTSYAITSRSYAFDSTTYPLPAAVA